ncbi:MAG: F0F1 ATP synthase subunit delta [Pseudomonadota bacterium]
MSEPKTLARPYAVAAYHFAQECNQVAAWETMLANIRTLVLTEQMQHILHSPAFDTTSLLKLLQSFSEKCLDASGLNFLKLLIANHRLVLAPMIFELFEAIKSKAENVVSVDVTTAVTLNATEQTTLIETIVKQLKQQVLPVFHVDDTLIAGAVIRVGDEYVLDGSMKTQLTRLKTQF